MESSSKNQKELILKALGYEVWQKTFENMSIEHKARYFRIISDSINEKLKDSKANIEALQIHKDTIRNFYKYVTPKAKFGRKHEPSDKTKDILSWYVLGDFDRIRTFKHFVDYFDSSSDMTYLQSDISKFEENIQNALEFEVKKQKKRTFIIMLLVALLTVSVGIIAYYNYHIYNTIQNSNSSEIDLNDINLEPLEFTKSISADVPKKEYIEKILSDFTFDTTLVVNKNEALRIMRWLGFSKVTEFIANTEPFYSGTYSNGCVASIWVGTYGNRDRYGFRFNCNNSIPSFTPFYIEVLKPQKTSSLFKKFYNSDLDQLNKDNWKLFNDSINLNLWGNPTYKNSNYLTLETFLGDSYLENIDYEPQVINILAHAINCGDCCEIFVKLIDFNPFQRYQQAGFYLFYEDIPYPSLRMTLGSNGGVSVIKRDGEYSNQHLIKEPKHGLRAKVYSVKNGDVFNPIDSIILKMRIENNHYFFSSKADVGDFIDIKSQKIMFPKPKYIGLAAFQGRPEIPFPIYPVAEILPVYFDYVRIKPCDN